MASSEYEIDARVGCKILVHSIKNKTKDVCGLLLGNVESGGRVRVTDAIPLFHHHVLSPGLEFAIENVREYCKDQKSSIIGMYGSNASAKTDAIRPQIKSSARQCAVMLKATDTFCVIQLLNQKFPNAKRQLPFKIVTPVSASRFGGGNASMRFKNWPATLSETLKLVSKADELIDFDDHLDDVRADWRNLAFNVAEPSTSDTSAASRVTTGGEDEDDEDDGDLAASDSKESKDATIADID
eukprot:g3289.t1